MFVIDQPPLDYSSEEVVLLAQASTSKNVTDRTAAKLGICHQVHNSPSRLTSRDGVTQEVSFNPKSRPEQTAMVPFLDLVYSYKQFMNQDLRQDTSATHPVEVRVVTVPHTWRVGNGRV